MVLLTSGQQELLADPQCGVRSQVVHPRERLRRDMMCPGQARKRLAPGDVEHVTIRHEQHLPRPQSRFSLVHD